MSLGLRSGYGLAGSRRMETTVQYDSDIGTSLCMQFLEKVVDFKIMDIRNLYITVVLSTVYR
jgi:hypothetical protein